MVPNMKDNLKMVKQKEKGLNFNQMAVSILVNGKMIYMME